MNLLPGEWYAREWSSHAATTVVAKDIDVVGGIRVIAECETETFARLIAAAPELLEACKQLTVAIVAINLRLQQPVDERERKAVAELRRLYALGQQAIAKAEGNQ